MELDELKQAWQTLDRRLQQQHSLQFAELYERRAGKIRSRLRPLFWGQLLQMLFGIAAIVVGVAIWNTMWMLTPALIGGIVVHVYGIATTAVSGLVLQRIVTSIPVCRCLNCSNGSRSCARPTSSAARWLDFRGGCSGWCHRSLPHRCRMHSTARKDCPLGCG